mmetsp:Transcript_20522/g.31137  ORF Transcript_20522/g.31137 Transcript_20522/m.31137 type:complete len:112 (+) Transcript_20522:108-443(+)|eukprot:CAMPEP_0194118212 /NCGR_PEP_ID=MMETSP0150-20130528/34524_1 /TAXON_ID=122233 /ORGANISM="Chaetoceros debilis, Strain MM31A-1" /LENGTH=111 /DNA_ID=CAMNT_0038809519 /DNA_START=1 /DNA_END=336 /DNA_ORIENTATION=-
MAAEADIQRVADLLNRRIKCTLQDGRTVEGNLQCLDRLKNIILDDAEEVRWIRNAASIYNPNSPVETKDGDDGKQQDTDDNSDITVVKRIMAQALIPGKHLIKVELLQEEN